MINHRKKATVLCIVMILLTTGFVGGSVTGAPVSATSATDGPLTSLEGSSSSLSVEQNKSESQTAYQIDVAVGGVIENLGDDKDAYYERQGRLLQALSVVDNSTVTSSFRVPTDETTKAVSGCAVTYDSVSYDATNDTAMVSVSTADCDEPLTLTLAAYELPDGTVEFNRSVADQQELVAHKTVSLDANADATVTINVTNESSSPSNETATETDNGTHEQTETAVEMTTETETQIETKTNTEESTPASTPDDGEETATPTETATETETETETKTETVREVETTTETGTETPASGMTDDLEISSVNKDAPGDESENLNGETVTITNTGDSEVDLSGVMLIYGINDENQQRYTFNSEFTLEAGGSVTIHAGSGSNTQTDVYLGNDAPILNNGEDETLRLVDGSGNTIDETTS